MAASSSALHDHYKNKTIEQKKKEGERRGVVSIQGCLCPCNGGELWFYLIGGSHQLFRDAGASRHVSLNNSWRSFANSDAAAAVVVLLLFFHTFLVTSSHSSSSPAACSLIHCKVSASVCPKQARAETTLAQNRHVQLSEALKAKSQSQDIFDQYFMEKLKWCPCCLSISCLFTLLFMHLI